MNVTPNAMPKTRPVHQVALPEGEELPERTGVVDGIALQVRKSEPRESATEKLKKELLCSPLKDEAHLQAQMQKRQSVKSQAAKRRRERRRPKKA